MHQIIKDRGSNFPKIIDYRGNLRDNDRKIWSFRNPQFVEGGQTGSSKESPLIIKESIIWILAHIPPEIFNRIKKEIVEDGTVFLVDGQMQRQVSIKISIEDLNERIIVEPVDEIVEEAMLVRCSFVEPGGKEENSETE